MSRAARGPGRRVDDDGQLVLLVLVYTLLALALVSVVVSATAVHLARHRLQAVADGAALDAADALDRQRFYAADGTGGLPGQAGPAGVPGPGGLPVASQAVRQSVDRYLASSDEARALPGLAVVEPTGSPDSLTAQVSLAVPVRVPLLSTLLTAWGSGLEVAVGSRAQARTTLSSAPAAVSRVTAGGGTSPARSTGTPAP